MTPYAVHSRIVAKFHNALRLLMRCCLPVQPGLYLVTLGIYDGVLQQVGCHPVWGWV